MQIGKFSKETGMSIDTLRYYNKIGLLTPSKIENRRCYTSEELERVHTIIKLKRLNFTLKEIKSLFELDENIEEGSKLDEASIYKLEECVKIISEKYEAILRQEKELFQVKHSLEKMLNKGKLLIDTGVIPDKLGEEKLK